MDNPTVIASTTNIICDDSSINLDATATEGSAAISTYAWSGPLSFSSSAEDPVILTTDATFPGVGTFIYTVTVTDANGCTDESGVSVTINGTPTVFAGGSTVVCGDQDISLTATGLAGSAAISGFAWSGPLGFSSTLEDPTILTTDAAYPGPGVHTYTVIVTDVNGCTDEATMDITVNAVPTITATAAAELCEDASIIFNATAVAGSASITTYQWSGPASFTSNLEDPVILPTDLEHPGPGTHTYNVTVTDANGCTGTTSVDITINQNPTVSITASTAICGDTPIIFNATSVQGSATISTYAWTGPSGFNSSLEDPTILPTDVEYPGPGMYTYSVTVTDANGCTGTANVDITIYVLPTVTATAATDFCGDQPIILNATGVQGGASITGYSWSGPNSFTSNLEDPTILPTDAAHPGTGMHTYSVTITDGNGCTSTATVDITVNANPTVTTTTTSQICGDTAINLDATAVEGSAAISTYAWSGPLSFSSSAEDPVILTTDATYPGVGTFVYTVTVTDANGCTDVANTSVTITGIPTVFASTTTPAVCGDQTIQLNATGVQGSAVIIGYTWDGPNGYGSTDEDPTILPTDLNYPPAGTHTYSVTITDANGMY